ncbi:YbaB/EbfC family nucleoid-associated protein [Pseudonocardia nantongensis]|uniref:YbaB/EbfC family nucleoid-associated protein n=1 Tax=Pseudonocardia nantongensis TaxID=1181885 RepID=UPI003979052C
MEPPLIAVPDRAAAGEAARVWLDDYRDRIDRIRVRAERARDQAQQVTATARTRDGAVTVTVDPSGALTGLTFGVRAEDLPRARLAELVLRLAREAAADAGAQVRAIVAPLTSEDGR